MSNMKVHDASKRLCGLLDGSYNYEFSKGAGETTMEEDLRVVLGALPAWPVDNAEGQE